MCATGRHVPWYSYGSKSSTQPKEPAIDTPPELRHASRRRSAMRGTRVIDLLAGQERRQARNGCTMVAEAPAAWQRLLASRIDYRKIFLQSYGTIRSICAGFSHVGVALIAIDLKQRVVAGSVCIAARVGEPNVAIVGRHGQSDLYLEGDPSMSLRHLAVLLHPATSWEPQRQVVSLLDLRTQGRFETEHGAKLDALVAEGPVFVRCGRFALLCLPVGDPSDYPASATDAWELIPERDYLDAQGAHHELGSPEPPRPLPPSSIVGERRNGSVTLVPGLVLARGQLLASGERPVGYLTAVAGDRARTVPVGPRALGRGVLIGRHGRCDQHDLLTDRCISRVHLMLRRVGERLFAVDLASTGRTFVVAPEGLRPVRLIALEGKLDLAMVHPGVRISWQPVDA